MGKTWKLPPLPPKAELPKLDFVSGSQDAEVVEIYGTQALYNNILKMQEVCVDAAGYEMEAIAREVIQDAQDNYVPVVTGNLQKSGDSDDYKPGRNQGIRIAMWFGGVVGPEALAAGVVDVREYAAEIHDNLTLNHPHGGGAKYLALPFDKIRGTITGRLAQAVGKTMTEFGFPRPKLYEGD